MANTLAELLVKLVADTTGYDKALAAATRKMEQFSADLVSSGWRASAAFSAPMAYLGKQALTAASQMEVAQVAFTTMIKDVDKAKSHIADIQKFTLVTPYQIEDVLYFSRLMQAYGTTIDQVIPRLTKIGNAVSALGGGREVMERVVRSMGEIGTRGKITQEQMREFARAGIDAIDALASHMGVSGARVQELVKASAVDTTTAMEALFGYFDKRFERGMESLSETAYGKWSNFKDKLFKLFSEIGAQPLQGLKWLSDKVLDPLLAKVGELTASLRDMPAAVQVATYSLGGLITGIPLAILGLGSLANVMTWSFKGLKDSWQFIKNIGSAIAEGIGTVVGPKLAEIGILGEKLATAFGLAEKGALVLKAGLVGLTVAGIALAIKGLSDLITKLGEWSAASNRAAEAQESFETRNKKTAKVLMEQLDYLTRIEESQPVIEPEFKFPKGLVDFLEEVGKRTKKVKDDIGDAVAGTPGQTNIPAVSMFQPLLLNSQRLSEADGAINKLTQSNEELTTSAGNLGNMLRIAGQLMSEGKMRASEYSAVLRIVGQSVAGVAADIKAAAAPQLTHYDLMKGMAEEYKLDTWADYQERRKDILGKIQATEALYNAQQKLSVEERAKLTERNKLINMADLDNWRAVLQKMDDAYTQNKKLGGFFPKKFDVFSLRAPEELRAEYRGLVREIAAVHGRESDWYRVAAALDETRVSADILRTAINFLKSSFTTLKIPDSKVLGTDKFEDVNAVVKVLDSSLAEVGGSMNLIERYGLGMNHILDRQRESLKEVNKPYAELYRLTDAIGYTFTDSSFATLGYDKAIGILDSALNAHIITEKEYFEILMKILDAEYALGRLTPERRKVYESLKSTMESVYGAAPSKVPKLTAFAKEMTREIARVLHSTAGTLTDILFGDYRLDTTKLREAADKAKTAYDEAVSGARSEAEMAPQVKAAYTALLAARTAYDRAAKSGDARARAELKKAVEEAEINYIRVRDAATEAALSSKKITDAFKAMTEAEKKATDPSLWTKFKAMVTDTFKEIGKSIVQLAIWKSLTELGKSLGILVEVGGKIDVSWKGIYTRLSKYIKDLGGAFESLWNKIKSIKWESAFDRLMDMFGDIAKAVWKLIVLIGTELLGAVKKIGGVFGGNSLLGGLGFGGGGIGGIDIGDGGGEGGVGIPGTAGGATAIGALVGGPIGAAIGAAVDLTTALWGLAKQGRQETSLNAIEWNTRASSIHLLKLLENSNTYWPKSKDIHDYLVQSMHPVLEAIAGGGGLRAAGTSAAATPITTTAPVTINIYGATDPELTSRKVMDKLRRTIPAYNFA